jgi:uncharacterized protein (TIGR00252 family)
MSTTDTGRAAEAKAADFLVSQGHTLLDRNWRNRWCEIDLVTRRAGTVHFVEVKYRASNAIGDPVAYIGPLKLQKLRRAASAWCQANQWAGSYQIDFIGLTGRYGLDYVPDVTGF